MTTPSTPLVANLGFVESPGDSLRQPGISNRFGILPAAAGSQQPRGHSLLFFRSTHCAAAIRVYFFFLFAHQFPPTQAHKPTSCQTLVNTHTRSQESKKKGRKIFNSASWRWPTEIPSFRPQITHDSRKFYPNHDRRTARVTRKHFSARNAISFAGNFVENTQRLGPMDLIRSRLWQF